MLLYQSPIWSSTLHAQKTEEAPFCPHQSQNAVYYSDFEQLITSKGRNLDLLNIIFFSFYSEEDEEGGLYYGYLLEPQMGRSKTYKLQTLLYHNILA